MSIIKRGAITVREHAAPPGRAYSYVVHCGACDLDDESLPARMPNEALAQLRRARPTTGAHRDGGAGQPWLIITGNDANGGNVPPFVRCGDCRTDRATGDVSSRPND